MAAAMAVPEEEVVAALRVRQAALWSRARSLCRRLRVLQARQVERHVRQQLAGLARYVGRVESAPPQALGPELRHLAASATARLRAAQGACDSDATDSSSCGSGSSSSFSSSSGSETDSESPELPAEEPQEAAGPPGPGSAGRHPAACQWAMERAAIICRWTWLQAQVSDLEYRIRQQTDIYRQLRANKGPVVLGDQQPEDLLKHGRLGSTAVVNSKRNKELPPSSSSILKVPSGERHCDLSPSIPSYLLRKVEKQNSHLTDSLGNLMCQSPPINGSPVPSKACTSSHQVNGIINCLNTRTSNSNSLDNLDPDRILSKQKQLNSLAFAAPNPDNSCVAARIRPICKYRKRRLIRTNAVSHLSRKPPKPLTMKCSCEWPTSCILCECKAPIHTVDPDNMSLEERIALLDSGFHPILSLSHGNPLHLHFEALLREDGHHRLSHNLKSLKMSQFGKKPGDLTNVCPKLGPSSISVPAGSLFKAERQLKGSANHSLLVSGPQSHRHSSLMHHLPSLCLQSAPAPYTSQFLPAGSSSMPAKKKKVECSYDINNIVIPMSMAAATRVEKLQYKEILTPSWRVVESKELLSVCEVDPELEDTLDEAYLNHHKEYEELERTRWNSWSSAISNRRGSRSSNKADDRWTPQHQPASPDPGCESLNDLLCAYSSVGNHSPEAYNTPQPLSVKGRARAALSGSEDTRSSTPEMLEDVTQIIQPWKPRSFPLSDAEYQVLLAQPSKGGGEQPDFQQGDSSTKQGFKTNNVDSGVSKTRKPCLLDGHPQADGSRIPEEFAGQPWIAGRLINNR
uniref:PEHE domain-containing protein n=1 Tax=Sphenodon punctatus TaxID=8508 RepID=A0A8D0HUE8_SPHPU